VDALMGATIFVFDSTAPSRCGCSLTTTPPPRRAPSNRSRRSTTQQAAARRRVCSWWRRVPIAANMQSICNGAADDPRLPPRLPAASWMRPWLRVRAWLRCPSLLGPRLRAHVGGLPPPPPPLLLPPLILLRPLHRSGARCRRYCRCRQHSRPPQRRSRTALDATRRATRVLMPLPCARSTCSRPSQW